eukprot:2301968-Pyramimonas_sp.AAC.1
MGKKRPDGHIVPETAQGQCRRCSACGCQRNEAWWTWCKHCHAPRQAPRFSASWSAPVPPGVWGDAQPAA